MTAVIPAPELRLVVSTESVSAESVRVESVSPDQDLVAACMAVMAVIAHRRGRHRADDDVRSQGGWNQRADLPRSGWPAGPNGWPGIGAGFRPR